MKRAFILLAGAALLNVSEDHLDRYADMAAYVEAKTRIVPMTATLVLPPGSSSSAARVASTSRVRL